MSSSSQSRLFTMHSPVLKSSGSAFEGFVRDEHTTLVEVDDRIFSTSIDLTYTYAPFAVKKNTSLDAQELLSAESTGVGSAWDGDAVAVKARAATLEIFAVDESASVQVRMRLTCILLLLSDFVFRIARHRPPCTRWVNASSAKTRMFRP